MHERRTPLPLIVAEPLASERWSVVCDFDGTIATVDATDALLERYALPEWREIEAEWKAGRIKARECMARQVGLLRLTRPELYAFARSIHIDPGFREFVTNCLDRRLPLRIVSDGLDLLIRRVLLRHGLHFLPLSANRLVSTAPDRFELRFPHARPGCRPGSGTCKCGIAGREVPSRVLLIGDGSSDFCLAHSASHVFAKGRLRDYCEEQGIAHSAFDTFADVRFLLSRLLDHSHHYIQRIAPL